MSAHREEWETGETRLPRRRRNDGSDGGTLADELGVDLRHFDALLERDRRQFGHTGWYKAMEAAL